MAHGFLLSRPTMTACTCLTPIACQQLSPSTMVASSSIGRRLGAGRGTPSRHMKEPEVRNAPDTWGQRHAPLCCCTLSSGTCLQLTTAAAARLLFTRRQRLFALPSDGQQLSSLEEQVWPSKGRASKSLLAHLLYDCRCYVLLLLLPGVENLLWRCSRMVYSMPLRYAVVAAPGQD